MTTQDLLKYQSACLRIEGYIARASDPAQLADSLSVENFPMDSTSGELLKAVVKFRRLRQDARVAAARRALARPHKPPVYEEAREAAHRAFRNASQRERFSHRVHGCPADIGGTARRHSIMCDAVTAEIERARAAS